MRLAVIVIATVLAVPAASAAQTKETINIPGVLEGLPFSAAVRVGEMLYLSGQIGTKAGKIELVEGGVAAETRQTLENIGAVLEYAGSSMDRIVKCTIFLADIADYATMNEVYRSFFPENPPARSTVAGSGLALGARVEIECIALVGSE